MPKQTIALCSVLACDTVNAFGSWIFSSEDGKLSSEDGFGCGDGIVVYELGAGLVVQFCTGEKLHESEISHGLKRRAGAAHRASKVCAAWLLD